MDCRSNAFVFFIIAGLGFLGGMTGGAMMYELKNVRPPFAVIQPGPPGTCLGWDDRKGWLWTNENCIVAN